MEETDQKFREALADLGIYIGPIHKHLNPVNDARHAVFDLIHPVPNIPGGQQEHAHGAIGGFLGSRVLTNALRALARAMTGKGSRDFDPLDELMPDEIPGFDDIRGQANAEKALDLFESFFGYRPSTLSEAELSPELQSLENNIRRAIRGPKREGENVKLDDVNVEGIYQSVLAHYETTGEQDKFNRTQELLEHYKEQKELGDKAKEGDPITRAVEQQAADSAEAEAERVAESAKELADQQAASRLAAPEPEAAPEPAAPEPEVDALDAITEDDLKTLGEVFVAAEQRGEEVPPTLAGWTGGIDEWVDANIREEHLSFLLEQLKEEEGGTLKPLQMLDAAHESGYYVASGKAPEVRVDLDEVSGKDIARFIVDNNKLFEEGLFFGVWVDKRNNQIVFDISEHYDSKEEAVEVGRERGEDAIWDIENDDEVRTDDQRPLPEDAAADFVRAYESSPTEPEAVDPEVSAEVRRLQALRAAEQLDEPDIPAQPTPAAPDTGEARQREQEIRDALSEGVISEEEADDLRRAQQTAREDIKAHEQAIADTNESLRRARERRDSFRSRAASLRERADVAEADGTNVRTKLGEKTPDEARGLADNLDQAANEHASEAEVLEATRQGLQNDRDALRDAGQIQPVEDVIARTSRDIARTKRREKEERRRKAQAVQAEEQAQQKKKKQQEQADAIEASVRAQLTTLAGRIDEQMQAADEDAENAEELSRTVAKEWGRLAADPFSSPDELRNKEAEAIEARKAAEAMREKEEKNRPFIQAHKEQIENLLAEDGALGTLLDRMRDEERGPVDVQRAVEQLVNSMLGSPAGSSGNAKEPFEVNDSHKYYLGLNAEVEKGEINDIIDAAGKDDIYARDKSIIRGQEFLNLVAAIEAGEGEQPTKDPSVRAQRLKARTNLLDDASEKTSNQLLQTDEGKRAKDRIGRAQAGKGDSKRNLTDKLFGNNKQNIEGLLPQRIATLRSALGEKQREKKIAQGFDPDDPTAPADSSKVNPQAIQAADKEINRLSARIDGLIRASTDFLSPTSGRYERAERALRAGRGLSAEDRAVLGSQDEDSASGAASTMSLLDSFTRGSSSLLAEDNEGMPAMIESDIRTLGLLMGAPQSRGRGSEHIDNSTRRRQAIEHEYRNYIAAMASPNISDEDKKRIETDVFSRIDNLFPDKDIISTPGAPPSNPNLQAKMIFQQGAAKAQVAASLARELGPENIDNRSRIRLMGDAINTFIPTKDAFGVTVDDFSGALQALSPDMRRDIVSNDRSSGIPNESTYNLRIAVRDDSTLTSFELASILKDLGVVDAEIEGAVKNVSDTDSPDDPPASSTYVDGNGNTVKSFSVKVWNKTDEEMLELVDQLRSNREVKDVGGGGGGVPLDSVLTFSEEERIARVKAQKGTAASRQLSLGPEKLEGVTEALKEKGFRNFTVRRSQIITQSRDSGLASGEPAPTQFSLRVEFHDDPDGKQADRLQELLTTGDGLPYSFRDKSGKKRSDNILEGLTLSGRESPKEGDVVPQDTLKISMGPGSISERGKNVLADVLLALGIDDAEITANTGLFETAESSQSVTVRDPRFSGKTAEAAQARRALLDMIGMLIPDEALWGINDEFIYVNPHHKDNLREGEIRLQSAADLLQIIAKDKDSLHPETLATLSTQLIPDLQQKVLAEVVSEAERRNEAKDKADAAKKLRDFSAPDTLDEDANRQIVEAFDLGDPDKVKLSPERVITLAESVASRERKLSTEEQKFEDDKNQLALDFRDIRNKREALQDYADDPESFEKEQKLRRTFDIGQQPELTPEFLQDLQNGLRDSAAAFDNQRKEFADRAREGREESELLDKQKEALEQANLADVDRSTLESLQRDVREAFGLAETSEPNYATASQLLESARQDVQESTENIEALQGVRQSLGGISSSINNSLESVWNPTEDMLEFNRDAIALNTPPVDISRVNRIRSSALEEARREFEEKLDAGARERGISKIGLRFSNDPDDKRFMQDLLGQLSEKHRSAAKNKVRELVEDGLLSGTKQDQALSRINREFDELFRAYVGAPPSEAKLKEDLRLSFQNGLEQKGLDYKPTVARMSKAIGDVAASRGLEWAPENIPDIDIISDFVRRAQSGDIDSDIVADIFRGGAPASPQAD
ncbi:MAG: hypothetical protein NWE76_06045, partial [Candidatus Bathyarchaeota archaeon]|nr:hypothetical protein [Candidatus Bathyarchaeota archaeon]